MKFKIDENLPVEIAHTLAEAGFEAYTVESEGLSGTDDFVVAERAASENRVLVTLDLDFGNIQTFPPHNHCGIIILRPHRQDKIARIALISKAGPLVKRANPGKGTLDSRT